jgi:hypothetical protein
MLIGLAPAPIVKILFVAAAASVFDAALVGAAMAVARHR